MTGLYLHVPFCSKKCHYCDFVVTTASGADAHARYLDALAAECAHYAPRFSGTRFSTLYVGGGTPAMLETDETRRLFETVRKYFSFEPGAEISWEANPGDLTPEKAAAYRALGVTRVSLGAQSFDDPVLATMNRAHDAAAIERTFNILKDAGIQDVNLDLMLALPGQDVAGARRSLERAAMLGPTHISLYELVVEERTVFAVRQKKGQLPLPPEERALEMLEEARAYLKKNGFIHYELLNYAKPGFESRHNRLYWANEDYLGLGPGAYSYFNDHRFRGSASYAEYLKKIASANWTPLDDEKLTPEARDVESLLLALRLTAGANLARFTALLPKKEESLRQLEDNGLLIRDEKTIRLSPRGQLFSETVFTELSS
jgi:oxygen-independent coproporphyrinogen-3 oxidase